MTSALTAAVNSLVDAKDAEIDELRAKLFPYADESTISGMGWSGFHLLGNKKSIEELQRIVHRSSQLEAFAKAYNEEVSRLKEEIKALQETKPVVAGGWGYSINYGPDGEENWANLIAPDGAHVANIRAHHARAIVASLAAALKAKDQHNV